MASIIEINDVSFSYKTDESLAVGVKNVSLSVEEGEFFVLLGHNGSGKSTLAKLINGFISPDEGKITVADIDVSDENRVFDLRSTVGMVFQNPDNQMVASIIEDDIAFGCENLGVPPEEIRRRVDWALETVGMSDRKDGTPFKLSGGQKQRVAIAAILAMLPKVLILDESTSMLDPEGRKEVLDTVRTLNKEHGMTVILITHYMDEAVSADRIGVMNGGELFLTGSPNEVFGNPKVLKEARLELPFATAVAYELAAKGIPVGVCLDDDALTEELCRLS
ncbi:MAG: energy-coupling factor transporter ATPase [Christensenellales bacterium]